jgi:ATP-binding cassette, subfamily B, bacterial
MHLQKHSRLHDIVRQHLHGAWSGILIALLCVAGYTAAELLAPWPLKIIFDHILLDKPAPHLLARFWNIAEASKTTALLIVSFAIIAIASFKGIFAYGQHYVTSRIGYQLVYKLRRELFLHLQSLSLSFHNRSRSGELLTKVTADTNALKDVFTDSALTLGSHVLTVAAMLCVMFFLNWRLTLIVISVIPLVCYSFFGVYRRVKMSARAQREREGRVASRLNEVLNSVSLVQAFAREKYEQNRFESESSRTLEEGVRTARIEAAATRGLEVLSAFALWAAVVFGSWQALKGRMLPGEILIFTGYLTSMYKPLRQMAKLTSQFSKASVSAERIASILDTEPESADVPSAVLANQLLGEIEFSGVSFSYGQSPSAVQKVSFRIQRGERVALVGSSGAGKSTIVSLILRLYQPTEGSIHIDGIDVRQYQRESLRREIGVVLQDAILFGASIRENINYGKPDALQAEIERAARDANIHGFIETLPEGYDTIIGERGCTLSGGQRQRLCLARAIIRRPSILILDEPTSAVDAESAALIRDAIDRLHAGKTMLMIAHQFVGIEQFDRILVLRAGELVEEGTHSELLRRNGHYSELLRLQALGSADTELMLAAISRGDINE